MSLFQESVIQTYNDRLGQYGEMFGRDAATSANLSLFGKTPEQAVAALEEVINTALAHQRRVEEERRLKENRDIAQRVFRNVEVEGLDVEFGPDGGVSLVVDDTYIEDIGSSSGQSYAYSNWIPGLDATHLLCTGGYGFRCRMAHAVGADQTIPDLTTGEIAIPTTGQTVYIGAAYDVSSNGCASAAASGGDPAGWRSGAAASVAAAFTALMAKATKDVFIWPVAYFTESGGSIATTHLHQGGGAMCLPLLG